jgi:hypothetical protein
MAGNGGKREGAGRKTAAEERQTRILALAAIIKKYGGEQESMEAMLNGNDTSMIKWVFEHAFGKPTENVNLKGELDVFWNEIKNYGANRKTDDSSGLSGGL